MPAGAFEARARAVPVPVELSVGSLNLGASRFCYIRVNFGFARVRTVRQRTQITDVSRKVSQRARRPFAISIALHGLIRMIGILGGESNQRHATRLQEREQRSIDKRSKRWK